MIKKGYSRITLTQRSQKKIADKLTDFLKQGICSIEFGFGDYDPFTKRKFKWIEFFKQKYALRINQEGPYRNDERILLRIPIAAPNDGRHFHKGAMFFFPKANEGVIYMKSPIQVFNRKFIKTYEVMKITLLAKAPYSESDQKLLDLCDEEIESSMVVDDFELFG